MSELLPRTPVNIHKAFPAGYQAMEALEAAVTDSPIEHSLYELVKLRASQINGCAFCLDMHFHDALEAGESLDRLALVRAWRETALFTDRERAALAMTEAVTLIADGHLPEDVEATAHDQFDEPEYAALVYAITTINAWNRLAITSHSAPAADRRARRATA